MIISSLSFQFQSRRPSFFPSPVTTRPFYNPATKAEDIFPISSLTSSPFICSLVAEYRVRRGAPELTVGSQRAHYNKYLTCFGSEKRRCHLLATPGRALSSSSSLTSLSSRRKPLVCQPVVSLCQQAIYSVCGWVGLSVGGNFNGIPRQCNALIQSELIPAHTTYIFQFWLIGLSLWTGVRWRLAISGGGVVVE